MATRSEIEAAEARFTAAAQRVAATQDAIVEAEAEVVAAKNRHEGAVEELRSALQERARVNAPTPPAGTVGSAS